MVVSAAEAVRTCAEILDGRHDDVPIEARMVTRAIERAHQSQLFASADVVEGLAAFGEKRAPRFAGR